MWRAETLVLLGCNNINVRNRPISGFGLNVGSHDRVAPIRELLHSTRFARLALGDGARIVVDEDRRVASLYIARVPLADTGDGFSDSEHVLHVRFLLSPAPRYCTAAGCDGSGDGNVDGR